LLHWYLSFSHRKRRAN